MYFVLTYDWEIEDYTPQQGIPAGPYTLFGLRKPLRELRDLGYEARPGDSSIYVYKE